MRSGLRKRRPVRTGLRSVRPGLRSRLRSVRSSVLRSESGRRQDRLRRQELLRRETRVLQAGLRR